MQISRRGMMQIYKGSWRISIGVTLPNQPDCLQSRAANLLTTKEQLNVNTYVTYNSLYYGLKAASVKFKKIHFSKSFLLQLYNHYYYFDKK